MMTSILSGISLNEYAAQRLPLIEQALEQCLAPETPAVLWESMRYSLLSGGKRFRALLCLASAEAVGGQQANTIDKALPCACAIEMVHAMSLIHDDLPCMDNDDYRRGKLTNHKVYGEALALLAGDGLLAFATQTLLTRYRLDIPASTLVDIAAELARAVGPQGMVGGQVEDCIATGQMTVENHTSPDQSEDKLILLESIHKKKTGALLRFSAWSGARLLEADTPVLNKLLEYGDILGMAFQIADDLLDITGDIKTLGKTPGKDLAAGKVTWVNVYGEEGARQTLASLQEKGIQSLLDTGLSDGAIAPLATLLRYAIERTS